MRNQIKTIALFVMAIMLAACGADGPNPIDPSPNPNPGSPNWSSIVNDVNVTPRPVAPGNTWEAKVLYKVNQGGLSYTSTWILKDPVGVEKTLKTVNNTTQANGNMSEAQYMESAPLVRGTYKLIWRYTESNGSASNTLTSETDLVVN